MSIQPVFFFFIHDMPVNFFTRTVVRQIGSRIVHGAARSRRVIHHNPSMFAQDATVALYSSKGGKKYRAFSGVMP